LSLEHAVEIDGYEPPPGFKRDFLDIARRSDPGVIDRDVD
jgi:hypothetical protein